MRRKDRVPFMERNEAERRPPKEWEEDTVGRGSSAKLNHCNNMDESCHFMLLSYLHIYRSYDLIYFQWIQRVCIMAWTPWSPMIVFSSRPSIANNSA